MNRCDKGARGKAKSIAATFGWLLGLGVIAVPAAVALQYSADRPVGATAQQLPAYLQHAGVQQHLNRTLPLNAMFTDDEGKTATLSNWTGSRPLVIALVYYKCTMMCPEVLHGLATGLRQTNLIPGKDYDVVTFSIDPADTPVDAAKKKAEFTSQLALHGATTASHFLTASEPNITAISNATGFEYVRVPGPDGKLNQFAHSSVIMFVTPDGRLSKYISGIDYPARDLRLAILEASHKKISNPVDLFLIYCCNYDPSVGKYSVAVLRIVSIAGAVTVLAVCGMVWLLMKKPASMRPA
jgi:protein SCO1